MTLRTRLRLATALALLGSAAIAQPEGPITTTGVAAHRGFSGGHVENTMPPFEAALELDVFTTGDGEFVVAHDGSTLKLTGEEGRIGEMTSVEIAALDAASDHCERMGMSDERMPPQRMPLLLDVLDRMMARDHVRAPLQPRADSTAAAMT